MGSGGSSSSQALEARLEALPGERERRAALVASGVDRELAAFLAEPRRGPHGWLSRALAALGGPAIGDRRRGARALAGALVRDPHVFSGAGTIEALVELAGSSDWAGRLLAASPQLVGELCRDARAAAGRPPTNGRESLPADVRRVVDEAEGELERFEAGLRRLRTQVSLRIALRELRGADIRATAGELADLASAALQGALAFHLPRLEAEVGRLEPPCRHLVIGLGKLGGGELNFSSDIDLIYAYEHDEGGAGELSSHQFHVRLFERVTNSLSKVTEDGRVFRVDIDLRPEGRTGALCNSLASLERYYETWGRVWERAAWIKARPVAGDLDLFAEVERFARPFVYRRSRDLAAVEAVVRMKGQIDASRRRVRLGQGGFDLKLGRGGIREIEFFCQGQQLLFGGRDPRLRVQNTLEALRALEVAGRLKTLHRERLADAYVFLRRLEHRIQLVEDRQTHVLPGPEGQLALARSLGFESAEALRARLVEHTNEVSELFSGLLGAVDEAPPLPPEVDLLLDPATEEAAKVEALTQLGARAPHSALANLATLGRIPRSPFHPAADDRGERLARDLLAECIESPDPDRALHHLPELLRALLSHGAYLEQLEKPDLRRGVVRVLGASDMLARILTANPGLLSGVLFAGELPTPTAVSTAVDALVDPSDVEATLAGLRLKKQEETLRIAMADLAAAIPHAEVQVRLTTLAEALVGATCRLALAEAEQRYGSPEDPEAALVLLAGGTLGAGELGYRSDVDLSAIFVGRGETVGGRRAGVGLSELYTRVMQRVLSFLSLRMPQGDLYPVDMRLRPSGSQGALVTSLDNFASYHRSGRAQLWERQALVRTRAVVGPPELRARVERVVFEATFGPGYGRSESETVHAMRVRMEEERSRRRKNRGGQVVDLKLGRGGLVEAEFLVQHLLLLHAPARPGLATSSTAEALARCREAELLPAVTSRRVARAHARLRRVVDWLRVIHDEMLDVIDLAAPSLRPVALALRYQGADAQERLRDDLEADRATIHHAYVSLLVADGADLGGAR